MGRGASPLCWQAAGDVKGNQKMAAGRSAAGEQVGLVPKLSGLGGMVSFQARLAAGLAQRGIRVSFDLDDPANRAILVIGGTRQVAALWRARRRGVRIVQRLNGMNWLQRKQNTPLRAFLRAEGNNLLLATIRRSLAHRIVYQSQFSREWWEKEYGSLEKPSQITYNGINLEDYTPAGEGRPPDDHYRLLLVEGHLGGGNSQGLENAVELAAGLQAKLTRPLELMVVGDVPAALQAGWQARSSRPGFTLTWTGVVRREQIPAIDRAAHLLFSADLNAACPNAVIEAMGCGLPVAAFDTGALAEIVQGEAGRVVPYGGNHWNLEPPRLPPLVEAAAAILADNARFRRGARARAEAAFGLERMLAGYLDALLG